MAIRGAKVLGIISLVVFFMIFGFASLIGYGLGGFFGVGMVALGYIAVPITQLSINLFAGLLENAHKMATVGRIYGKMRDELYKIAWAARNYIIFT